MNLKRKHFVTAASASLAWLLTTHAYGHFVVLKPASWLKEDALGGPQKGSPCGPGNTRPFIGDDVQPIPASGAVTTFHAGETITVQWQETVYHPGYFRISLAPVAAADATSADFPNPALTDPDNCHYDPAAVQTVPHDNVLADGLYMVDAQSGTNRSLTQDVKLPDAPCDHCTLQIVQVMECHPAASCFYFHCADIQVLPAESGSAGGAAGAGAAGSAAASHESSGCAVAGGGRARGSKTAAGCLLLAAWAFERRRRSRLPAA